MPKNVNKCQISEEFPKNFTHKIRTFYEHFPDGSKTFPVTLTILGRECFALHPHSGKAGYATDGKPHQIQTH